MIVSGILLIVQILIALLAYKGIFPEPLIVLGFFSLMVSFVVAAFSQNRYPKIASVVIGLNSLMCIVWVYLCHTL